MILGIDTGGTNIDGVLVEEDIVATAKVPHDNVQEGIETMLSDLTQGIEQPGEKIERVVVATTLVVNAAVQDQLPKCTNILIPGPGLSPERSFYGEANQVLPGCIDHRGRITEEVDYEKLYSEDELVSTDIGSHSQVIDAVVSQETPTTPVVAVTAKFSPRNPALEQDIRSTLDYDNEHIALGNESGGGMTFLERAATTVANAKAKPIFVEFQCDVATAVSNVGITAPIYYLKGDGAMLSDTAMRSAPAHTLRTGIAASTSGLLALTGDSDAIYVDIGGATTDLARVTGGFPDFDADAQQGSIEPAYDGVTSISLPLGGDTLFEQSSDGIVATERRDGDAAAFDGAGPSLTDALHVMNRFTAGDVDAARSVLETLGDSTAESVAKQVVRTYVDRVATAIETLATATTDTIVVGGMLAQYLADNVAAEADTVQEALVPEHAEVAGAIGCAVARVSVDTAVHIDSARGVKTVTAVGAESVEDVEQGTTFTDEQVEKIAVERAQAAAEAAGGDADHACEILHTDRFNVVEDAKVKGQIVDTTARVEPGIEQSFTGDSQ